MPFGAIPIPFLDPVDPVNPTSPIEPSETPTDSALTKSAPTESAPTDATTDGGLTTPADSDQVSCPIGWVEFNGFCYKVHPRISGDFTTGVCEKENATLVSIHSEAENKFILGKSLNFATSEAFKVSSISGLAKPKPGHCDWEYQIWLGLKRTDGAFSWDDGTPMDFTKWKVSEPNNRRGEENCGHMWVTPGCNITKSEVGEWNDNKCHHAMTVICKKSKESGTVNLES